MMNANDGIDRNLKMFIKEVRVNDLRRYNAPTNSEIAVVLPGDGSEVRSCRDIIINSTDNHLYRIHELNCNTDPLHYVLLFPKGDSGFHLRIPYTRITENREFMTQSEFYAYRLMVRENDNSVVHRGGRLFQQYIVDQYAKIEKQRLNYIRTHQNEIRADLYQDVANAAQNNQGKPCFIGRRVILPSSFTGGPRQMQQLDLDSMAIIMSSVNLIFCDANVYSQLG
jgi:REP element-mobilizing transposase RayT